MNRRTRLDDFTGERVTNLAGAFGRMPPDALERVDFLFGNEAGGKAFDR